MAKSTDITIPPIVEEWRPIAGHEGRYEVSSQGRVRSIERRVERNRRGTIYDAALRSRVLRPEIDRRDGWPRLTLWNAESGRGPKRSIARLVAEAFLGQRYGVAAIEFVDGNPSNCAVENLSVDVASQEGEIWLDVCGWEPFYQVSNHGRIRSKLRVCQISRKGTGHDRRIPARLLKTFPVSELRYPAIVLQSGGRKRRATLHTLVCEAFHGPNPGGREVAHADGNPLNSRADNLRWATKVENSEDKIITGFAEMAGISPEAVRTLIQRIRKERTE